MLINIEELSYKYITYKDGLTNGRMGNPFWLPKSLLQTRDAMDYSAELAAKRIPLEYLSFTYPYQCAFQRVLITGILRNKRNLLFLVTRLVACGHTESTVKMMIGVLKLLKGSYRDKIFYALIGDNSFYMFAHIQKWNDHLMTIMIDRLRITDVKYHPAMKKIYNIIKLKDIWIKMFMVQYRKCITSILTITALSDNNNELLLSLINDVDGFDDEVNLYLIDKINENLTKVVKEVWIDKLCLLMAKRLSK